MFRFPFFLVTSLFLPSLVGGEIVPMGLTPFRLFLNSGWSKLGYEASRGEWISNEVKIDAPHPITVMFTDAFCPGEMVAIHVNGAFLLNSTSVAISNNCEPNFRLPMQGQSLPDIYSQASFTLGPGQHSIALKLIQGNEDLPNGAIYLSAFVNIKSAD